MYPRRISRHAARSPEWEFHSPSRNTLTRLYNKNYCIRKTRLVKVFFFNFVFNIHNALLWSFNIIPFEVWSNFMYYEKYAMLCIREKTGFRSAVHRAVWHTWKWKSERCSVVGLSSLSDMSMLFLCFYLVTGSLSLYMLERFSSSFRCVHKRFRSCSSRGAHIIESEGQYFTSLFTLPARSTRKKWNNSVEKRLPRGSDETRKMWKMFRFMFRPSPRLHSTLTNYVTK